MNGTHTGQDGPFANDHMSGYLGIIAHDHIITNNTVVGKMGVCHDQAIFSNGGLFPVGRTTVHRNKFTDGGIIANHNRRIFAMEFQILRNGCNHRTRKNAAVFADPRTLHNCYIGADPWSG